jgi:outer membrane protein insertion porin family/translocation and assembly module TamA
MVDPMSWLLGRPRAHGTSRAAPWLPVPLWPALLAALLLPAPLAAQRGLDDGHGPFEVTALRFEGNHIFDRILLRDAIVTQTSDCRLPFPLSLPTCGLGFLKDRHEFDELALRRDEVRLKVFYFSRGYRDATVKARAERRGDGVEVVVDIDAGEPVRVTTLAVEGDDGILPADLAQRLPLRLGAPFALPDLEASRDSLIAALKNRGYPRADVLTHYLVPAEADHEAWIRFELIPGTRARWGEIEIRGTDRVEPAIVRRLLTFRTGDTFRQSELQRSQSNLFDLDLFRYAAIQPDFEAEPDSIIPVTIQVTESDLHRIRLGAGLNQADCVNAEGRWTSRNLLGGARRLELRGSISNVLASRIGGIPCNSTGGGRYDDLNGSLAVDFTQPWIFGLRNSFGAGVFVEKRSVPEVYIRNARGGHLSLSRRLGPRTAVGIAFRPELTWLDAESDLFFCTSFVSCESDEIQVLSSPHWLAPLQLYFTRDHSNALFSPTGGYILRLEAERAASVLGSDFSYIRTAADLSTYHDVGAGVVLATHLRPGWARALDRHGDASALGLNPQRRFFAGGPNSVRGFAHYRLGPKVLKIDGTRLAAPVDSGGAGCAPAEINSGQCAADPIAPDRFDPRAVGGGAMLEGSLELRFPIQGENWNAAAFVDFGQVWRSEREVRLDDLVFTPGLGVRYHSPIGPIRIDVGYNGMGGERLQVITNEVQVDPNAPGVIDTGEFRVLDNPVFWNPRQSFFERLQFHFSIGQAF